MNDKLFLIAIGGTGMRCLESFVHLCAAGMFDNHTIDILTIDTDQSNGNKDRVEHLIDLYNRVKTNDLNNVGGLPRTDTFFSAKLNLRRFFTDYSTAQRKTYNLLSDTSNLSDIERQDNKDISDLFFETDSVQQFPLDHGYRAQTHLGSMLMYHGIIEAAINYKKGGKDVGKHEVDLAEFIKELNQHAANARVFVFGSVFGGTGASSIPVFPLAMSEALKIITGGTTQINTQKVLFGSTLLTDYFTFNIPTDQEKKTKKVIADANNFALNSQAALSFYDGDASVMTTYKRMYHIGWPSSSKVNYSKSGDVGVITGGNDQRNDCHVAELMCAAAAYDFFNEDRSVLERIGTAEYRFREVEKDESNNAMVLKGASFIGSQSGSILEKRLGAFLTFAHVILSKNQGAYSSVNGIDAFMNYVHTDSINYTDVNLDQRAEINEYVREFGYKIIDNDTVDFGWIYQIRKSVGPGSFIFSPEAFKTIDKELLKTDIGTLYGDGMRDWCPTNLIGNPKGPNSSYDKFCNTFKDDQNSVPYDVQGDSSKELFFARMFNAITTLIG